MKSNIVHRRSNDAIRSTAAVAAETAPANHGDQAGAAPPRTEHTLDSKDREVTIKTLPNGSTIKCTTLITPQLMFQREQESTIREAMENGEDGSDMAVFALRTLARRPDLIEWFVKVHYGLSYDPATPAQQEAAIETARRVVAARQGEGRLERLTKAEKRALRRFSLGDVLIAIDAYLHPGPDDKPIVPVLLAEDSKVEELRSRPFELLSDAEKQVVRRRIVQEGISPLFRAIRYAAYRNRENFARADLGLKGIEAKRTRAAKRGADGVARPLLPDELAAPGETRSEEEILREIGQRNGFSPDQINIWAATKIWGYQEKELPALLGWTPQKVERISRSLSLDRHGHDMKTALTMALLREASSAPRNR